MSQKLLQLNKLVYFWLTMVFCFYFIYYTTLACVRDCITSYITEYTILACVRDCITSYIT